MDDRVLRKLEYEKILDMLAAKAQSAMGKELAKGLRPSTSYEVVNVMLEQCAEAETALGFIGRNPVDSFTDATTSLEKTPVTIALSPKSLLDIAKSMRAIRMCKDRLNKEEVGPYLKNFAARLHATRYIEEKIFRCIISEEEIADNASPALARIRQKIRASSAKIKERINQMLRSAKFKDYLQEEIITIRNGRYVLPVKQENRGSVPGLLHDQSGSGATLFIEPMELVEIGNEIRGMELEEREEIDRILSDLTQQIAPDSRAVADSLITLAQIDLIFAKALLAGTMKSSKPTLNKANQIKIVAGRHPLLDQKTVVPIDIWVGVDFSSLIITGPNTGGKTVTLKTVGLFAAMCQSGLFLPTATGVTMPVFQSIFADIGDEQSIEQSLSTFSAHMKNIVDIINNANADSLVLLDELGSGTDPVEGAALAMAILEELLSRGCTTLATTHYSELKGFALTHEGMQNASMEFDVNTLSPTYRLFVGIPGKSNAFEISRKLGLSSSIIDSAQKFIKREDVEFEDLISSAEDQRKIAEQERELAEEARAELFKIREQTRNELINTEKKREEIIRKARAELRSMFHDSKKESEKIIVELKKSLKDGLNTREMDRVIQGTRDAIREKGEEFKDEKPEKAGGVIPKKVFAGQEVYIPRLDQKAIVLEQLNDREVQLQVGIIKTVLVLDDVREIKQESKKQRAKTTLSPVQAVSFELDLRGERIDDGLIELERYISRAHQAGLEEVTIIHGKGTGALRDAVQEHLRREHYVEKFRMGAYGEGDAGVTIVKLRQ